MNNGDVAANLTCQYLFGEKQPLVIYGAGEMGQQVIKNFIRVGLMHKIIALADSKAEYNSHSLEGIEVIAPSTLPEYNFTTLLIASGAFVEDIKETVHHLLPDKEISFIVFQGKN